MKARRRRAEVDIVELEDVVRRRIRTFVSHREIVAREGWRDGRARLDEWIPFQRTCLVADFPDHVAEFDELVRNAPEKLLPSDSGGEKECKLRDLRIRMVAFYDGMIRIWQDIADEISRRITAASGLTAGRADGSGRSSDRIGSPRSGKIYGVAYTHRGRRILGRAAYSKLTSDRSAYDLFLDGFSREVWRRSRARPHAPSRLRPATFALISEYIREKRALRPEKTSAARDRHQTPVAARKCFEAARRAVETAHSGGSYTVFRTVRTSVRGVSYVFDPPPGFKYCLILQPDDVDI